MESLISGSDKGAHRYECVYSEADCVLAQALKFYANIFMHCVKTETTF